MIVRTTGEFINGSDLMILINNMESGGLTSLWAFNSLTKNTRYEICGRGKREEENENDG
jgi:hypothetical protein